MRNVMCFVGKWSAQVLKKELNYVFAASFSWLVLFLFGSGRDCKCFHPECAEYIAEYIFSVGPSQTHEQSIFTKNVPNDSCWVFRCFLEPDPQTNNSGRKNPILTGSKLKQDQVSIGGPFCWWAAACRRRRRGNRARGRKDKPNCQ